MYVMEMENDHGAAIPYRSSPLLMWQFLLDILFELKWEPFIHWTKINGDRFEFIFFDRKKVWEEYEFRKHEMRKEVDAVSIKNRERALREYSKKNENINRKHPRRGPFIEKTNGVICGYYMTDLAQISNYRGKPEAETLQDIWNIVQKHTNQEQEIPLIPPKKRCIETSSLDSASTTSSYGYDSLSPPSSLVNPYSTLTSSSNSYPSLSSYVSQSNTHTWPRNGPLTAPMFSSLPSEVPQNSGSMFRGPDSLIRLLSKTPNIDEVLHQLEYQRLSNYFARLPFLGIGIPSETVREAPRPESGECSLVEDIRKRLLELSLSPCSNSNCKKCREKNNNIIKPSS